MSVEQPRESSLSTSVVAWVLIAIATAIQIARIVGMTASHGELPFLSANDRSRWCAIAALTQDGRWEIDKYTEILDSKGKSKIWNTIDLVKHVGADGVEHSYSSKPPLLTLMLAAVCKPLTMVLGKNLTDDPFLIGRSLLLIVNALPLVLFWVWWQRWLDRHVMGAWSRFLLLNIGLWGTFLTTFVATLNNHLHGAMFFVVTLVLTWQITSHAKQSRETHWGVWIALGICSAMTVACELPALAWAAGLGLILVAVNAKKAILGYGMGALAIAAAFLGTNYWAHGDWRPPYSHRGLGAKIGQVRDVDVQSTPTVSQVIASLAQDAHPLTEAAEIVPARLEGVLQVRDETTRYRVALKAGAQAWDIYAWDDWYDYPKSYWLPENKKGVDRGEPNRWAYLVHFLIGHHGLFSLTPLWIWSLAGVFFWLRTNNESPEELRTTWERWRHWMMSDGAIAIMLALVSLACTVFYASRDVVDRNYAGVCSGFRWMFWLIPAWMWMAVPAVEWSSQRRWARWALVAALCVSVLSATLPWPNPWSHPWPYRLLIWWDPNTFQ